MLYYKNRNIFTGDKDMNGFNERYEEELLKQEKKANERVLIGLMLIYIFLTVTWLLTSFRFFVINAQVYNTAYGISILFGLPLPFIYKKTQLSEKWVKYILMLIVCLISGVIATLLTFHAPLVYVVPLLLAVQYRDKGALWGTFFLDAVLVPVSLISGFYYGICDLNLLLGSNHTLSWYLPDVVDGHLTLPVAEHPVFVMVLYGALPIIMILLVFTVMLQYAIVSSAEDTYRIADLTYRREIDTATRLYNKTKYEEMISGHYMSVEFVAAIMWDINNLKEINDRLGHSMGDKLIETLSYAIYEQTGKKRQAYRIGGDEFVMIIENPQENEEAQVIQAVLDHLERHRKEGGLMESSAVGSARGEGIDILKVVHEADECMYENKRKCKEGR